MEEVRWEFEQKILTEDSIRNKCTSWITDKLVDATVYSWKRESVVMFKKPADREKSTSRILTIVDTVGRCGDTRYCANMCKRNTLIVFLASAEIERGDGHRVRGNFEDWCDRVSAARVPVTKGVGARGLFVRVG